MSLWPSSLFGRVAAILLAGLTAAYALSYWSVMRERADLAESMMLAYVGRDVVSSVAMLDRLPASERAAWLRKLQRPNYRFTLDGQPLPPQTDAVGVARRLAASLNAELGPGRLLGVGVEDPSRTVFSLRLADGAPLTLQLMTPRKMVSTGTALLLALQLAVVGACIWWGVRVATRPLSDLASAATRLGDDPQAAELPEHGPAEVRRAIAAFNTMQRRISAHLAERLQILAAVSHDLQTPITRMRVRTDLLADEALRDKLQADLIDMQHLVEEGLAYARTAHASMEKMQAIDLHALLDGLVCDYRDAGRQVELIGSTDITVTTRPQALKRIAMNLVDNALKFAGEAQVVVSQADAGWVIEVLDKGPGMAEDQLLAVLQPFYRVEGSRNRETGGSGLGLAIAHRLSGALGATLSLHNRPGGGLQARLALAVQG
ncbi:MAG: ATP-binding protein [Aquabacterium sp.]|uniref:ATP-binding protein n=1 Tax=Aquabacterium sp. TaxID=1872578 RepID=UPI002728C34D|nr:ATP-binding protein [Aquabacterium sp.]MDO9005605.1 ATP-binding protein [Aquabacterium sp.]